MRQNHPIRRVASRSIILVFFLMIAGVMALNAALVSQNRELKASLSSWQRVLEPGDEVPPLKGFDLDDRQVTLDYDGRFEKTLILLFSPLCGWCDLNLDNWQAMLQGVDRSRFRVVAISTTSKELTEYAEKSVFKGFEVLHQIEPKDKRAYMLYSTPQTIVIGRGGKVEKVWDGAFLAPIQEEVETYFGVRLPGLPDVPELGQQVF